MCIYIVKKRLEQSNRRKERNKITGNRKIKSNERNKETPIGFDGPQPMIPPPPPPREQCASRITDHLKQMEMQGATIKTKTINNKSSDIAGDAHTKRLMKVLGTKLSGAEQERRGPRPPVKTPLDEEANDNRNDEIE